MGDIELIDSLFDNIASVRVTQRLIEFQFVAIVRYHVLHCLLDNMWFITANK